MVLTYKYTIPALSRSVYANIHEGKIKNGTFVFTDGGVSGIR